MMAFAKFELLGAVSSLLYPPVCTICLASVGAHEYLCDDCHGKTTRIAPPFCARCSEPFSGAISGPFTCANCAHRRLYFKAAVSVYRSRGIVRRVVHDFKYGRQRHLRHLVAQWLCAALDDERLCGRKFEMLVPNRRDAERMRSCFKKGRRYLYLRRYRGTRLVLIWLFLKSPS